MGLQDFFAWRSQAATNAPAVVDDDVPADLDEPPDRVSRRDPTHPDFYKSLVRPSAERKESLLTQALTKDPEAEKQRSDIHVTTDLTRRRSMLSNASIASTAELTSDGGLTSPARTNTPSPPPPDTTFTSFAPYSFAGKAMHPPELMVAKIESKDTTHPPEIVSVSPKAQLLAPVAAPKKRCITFACGGGRNAAPRPAPAGPAEQMPIAPMEAPKPRVCTIKFACAAPKPEKPATEETTRSSQAVKLATPRRTTSRSPSMTRKFPRQGASARSHRDSNSTIRRSSQSPTATKSKPKFIIVDEKTLESSDATRFHEFASGELREDDWIRNDIDLIRKKLTISDTLKMENAIRQLGNEVEEEALEDEEEGNDQITNDLIEENDDGDEDEDKDEDDEDEDDEDEDDLAYGSSDSIETGNETDNEAGFADSDDGYESNEDFAFWTPGRLIGQSANADGIPYRPSAHRAASTSSIDSLSHMSPEEGARRRRRPIKIRPGTPDLPDSTDFVCGTLDEDRPLEDAYVSCMEQKKNAKRRQCPQDIDPSFPTSDPENEEDDDEEDDVVDGARSSEDHVWLHGKFEDSDDELHGRRRSIARKSPAHSPRRLHSPPPPTKHRLHSPPPPKHRLRSPPPRKLFGGHSPKRTRSPPPARTVRSPATSPSSHVTNGAIAFAPLAARPGLTHTKSLPRTPNAFCRQYRAARLAAANGNDGNEDFDGHVRGAIDIVKGLEQKRQRRKEKFYQKQNNRKKGHPERRPQPGKGAERMRELGLLMAGKTGANDAYMLSA